jgi:hypothetical protein
MAASLKRTPFNIAGPFLSRKNFSIFEMNLKRDDVFGADVFADLHARRAKQLFNAGYFDMCPAELADRALTATELGGARPLDRDGDGHDGGSLSEREVAALAQAGHSLESWLALPEPERSGALAAALAAAPPETEGGNGGDSGAGGGEGSEKPEEAPAGGEGGDDTTAGPGGAPAPADEAVAGYKHFGFGKWFAVNAAGEKLGAKLSKAGATAASNLDGKPLIGMMG